LYPSGLNATVAAELREFVKDLTNQLPIQWSAGTKRNHDGLLWGTKYVRGSGLPQEADEVSAISAS